MLDGEGTLLERLRNGDDASTRHEAAEEIERLKRDLSRLDRRVALLTWRMDECSRAAAMTSNAVQGRSDPADPYEALNMAKPEYR